jgi:NarL family two-component system response regulator LiaR
MLLPLSMTNSAPYRIGVLICDDADSLLLLLRVVVGLDPGLHVAGEARNGQEAILEAARLQPDVILLDLSMPVLTGLDALPAIKAAAPGAHVIAFTGLSASVVEAAVRRAGADSFLEKGALPDVIAEAIKQAFAAGRNGDGKRPSLAGVELQSG